MIRYQDFLVVHLSDQEVTEVFLYRLKLIIHLRWILISMFHFVEVGIARVANCFDLMDRF